MKARRRVWRARGSRFSERSVSPSPLPNAKSRAYKPRHQRSVLHWIPEPEAAPTEFVVSPIRTHSDTDREEHPGGKCPRPHPARPGSVNAPFDQRCNGKRKGDRETNVTEV